MKNQLTALFLLLSLLGMSAAAAHERRPVRERRPPLLKKNPCVDRDRIREARRLIPQQFSGWNARNAVATTYSDGSALRILTEGPLIAILATSSLERLQPPIRASLQLRTPNRLPVVFSWVEPSRNDDVFRTNDDAIMEFAGSAEWQTGSAVLRPSEPVRRLRMLLITSAPTPVDIASLLLTDSAGRTARYDLGKNPARPAWVNGAYLEFGRE